jgi:hypothetical protein
MHHFKSIARIPATILQDFAVNVLLVDVPLQCNGAFWMDWICNAFDKPVLVIESWSAHSILQDNNPLSKQFTTMWKTLGYNSDGKLLNAHDFNAAISQQRFLVRRSSCHLDWQKPSPFSPRSMENVLRPTGVPKLCWKRHQSGSSLPLSTRDPIPERPGSLIQTPTGPCQTLSDEVARAKGVPSNWLTWCKYGDKIVLPNGFCNATNNTTALALWEAAVEWPTNPVRYHQPRQASKISPSSQQDWSWHPPDLSVDGTWFKQQKHSLLHAIRKLALSSTEHWQLYQRCMTILDTHRTNYDDFGPTPTTLQVIWWNFPSEHWQQLLDGFSMNFLTEPQPFTPVPAILEKGQLDTIDQFMGELV